MVLLYYYCIPVIICYFFDNNKKAYISEMRILTQLLHWVMMNVPYETSSEPKGDDWWDSYLFHSMRRLRMNFDITWHSLCGTTKWQYLCFNDYSSPIKADCCEMPCVSANVNRSISTERVRRCQNSFSTHQNGVAIVAAVLF